MPTAKKETVCIFIESCRSPLTTLTLSECTNIHTSSFAVFGFCCITILQLHRTTYRSQAIFNYCYRFCPSITLAFFFLVIYLILNLKVEQLHHRLLCAPRLLAFAVAGRAYLQRKVREVQPKAFNQCLSGTSRLLSSSTKNVCAHNNM